MRGVHRSTCGWTGAGFSGRWVRLGGDGGVAARVKSVDPFGGPGKVLIVVRAKEGGGGRAQSRPLSGKQ